MNRAGLFCAMVLPVCSAIAEADDAEARAVIDRAVKAVGGAEKLAKF